MQGLEDIGDRIIGHLEQKNQARDLALQSSRTLIRSCSLAIRAVHRGDREGAGKHLSQAEALVRELQESLEPYPDLYHAGYTQDALKEFSEASIVRALIHHQPLPDPDQLGVEYAAYLGGLGEAAGELRRSALDLLRHDRVEEAEGLLEHMDEIYSLLVRIDFPSAITGNLRRTTDVVRGVTERTRGDITTSFQQRELRRALQSVESKIHKDD